MQLFSYLVSGTRAYEEKVAHQAVHTSRPTPLATLPPLASTQTSAHPFASVGSFTSPQPTPTPTSTMSSVPTKELQSGEGRPAPSPSPELRKAKDESGVVSVTVEEEGIRDILSTISEIEERGFIPASVDSERVKIQLVPDKYIGPRSLRDVAPPALKFGQSVVYETLGAIATATTLPAPSSSLSLTSSSAAGPSSSASQAELKSLQRVLSVAGEVIDATQIGPKMRLDNHPNLAEVTAWRVAYTMEDRGKLHYATAMLLIPADRWKVPVTPSATTTPVKTVATPGKASATTSPEQKLPPKGTETAKTVIWCHGTTGIQWVCAPSNQSMQSMDRFLGGIPGLKDFLREGCAVIAPDYLGLGLNPNEKVKSDTAFHRALLEQYEINVPSVHPYLVGTSLGKSICYAAKALCADSPNNPWNLPKKVVLFGHSEGGFAAIWASKLWNSTLDRSKSQITGKETFPVLAGAAISSPATALGKTIDEKFESAAGKIIGSYGLYAWANYYRELGLNINDIAKPEYVPVIKRIAESCVITFLQMAEVAIPAYMMAKAWYKKKPTEIPAWNKVIAENTPLPEGITCPVLLIQGEKDDIVPPQITIKWGVELTLHNTRVTWAVYKNDSHFSVTKAAIPELIKWLHGL